MYRISALILMHPLWAAPISRAHTYTIILTLEYFEIRKEFPLVLFLSFALSGFLCNKPLQLTAYLCTSTMNLLFTNVWATIQCIGMAQLRYAKGHTHKNKLNWSVLKKNVLDLINFICFDSFIRFSLFLFNTLLTSLYVVVHSLFVAVGAITAPSSSSRLISKHTNFTANIFIVIELGLFMCVFVFCSFVFLLKKKKRR